MKNIVEKIRPGHGYGYGYR